MKMFLRVLTGFLFLAFSVVVVGSIVGCGSCGGWGDVECYSYEDGSTVCYDNEGECGGDE